MPKTEKRVYTYDQLDSILRRRGVKHDKIHVWMARLRSTVHVTTTYSGVGFALRHVSSAREHGFEFARIYKVAGGDTLYHAFGIDKDKARMPRLRGIYRRAVGYFTPHDIVGRTPATGTSRWFRIHDGTARPVPAPETVASGEPLACWLGYHQVTRPSYDEWLSRWREQHPRLCNRARSFYVRLRRELRDGLPCVVQMIRQGELMRGAWLPDGPALHVCVPPTPNGPALRLTMTVSNHDLNSRRHFGVDGDFGYRHAQVWAVPVSGRSTKQPEGFRWKSTRDAIVGVKEWVMSSVYIPGF